MFNWPQFLLYGAVLLFGFFLGILIESSCRDYQGRAGLGWKVLLGQFGI